MKTVKIHRPRAAYLVIHGDQIVYRADKLRHAVSFNMGFKVGQIVKARPAVIPPLPITTDNVNVAADPSDAE